MTTAARPAAGPHSGRHIARPRPDQVSRFWDRVLLGDGCWEWAGSFGPSGYGTFTLSNQGQGPFPAHRVSYAISRGWCKAGRVVMHLCDNKKCVRPDHLKLGTQGENSRDAIAKWLMTYTRATSCKRCGGERCHERHHYALCDRCRREHLRTVDSYRRKIGLGYAAWFERLDAMADALPPDFERLAAVAKVRPATVLAKVAGLYGSRGPRSLEQVGTDLGVSRERARQLLSVAEARLGVRVPRLQRTFTAA